MNELSLFSGAGGGLLATQHLLGWKTVGYVEIDEYCQAVLAQRIKDGYLDCAPIFGDIRRFISEGYAGAYSGMVDVITAGFPCQPFSVAGQRKAEQDERNLWPDTIECLRIVRPRYAFLENVPGLLATDYIRRIYGDLAEAGYDGQWCVLGADDVGAPQEKKRWWCLAYAVSEGLEISRNFAGESNKEKQTPTKNKSTTGFTNLANHNIFTEARNWPCESMFLRKCHGIPNRMDRIKSLGEAQVPRVVEAAWEVLRPREKRDNADI